MEIGTITEVKKDESRIVCRVQFGENDYCTAILYGLASQNEYPMIDDEVAVNRSDEENIIVAVYRPLPDGISSGESITYGRDGDGAIVSSVKLGADGQVQINGGGRSTVGFPDLKSGFDTIKQDLNNLITAYNAHIHVTTATIGAGPAVGVIAPTTSIGVSSSASVDASESATVEVP